MEQRKHKPIAQVILIPLIDVLTFFLFIFMLAYSKMTPYFQAQKVDIPKSSTAEKITKDKESMEIAVDKDGNLYIDNKKIIFNNLGEILDSGRKQGIKKVVIRGDKKSPYEKIIQVIDRTKMSGIEKVMLVTRKEP